MTKEMTTKTDVLKWTTDIGDELQFSVQDIKEQFTDNPAVTDKECIMFGQICKAHRLNPYLRDAYLIKFGTSAAQLIVGKNAVLKIAQRHKDFDGFQAGIIVLDKSNKVHRREGCMVLDDEKLIGGWAKAFRKDVSVPFYEEVSIKEYSKKAQWGTMPATMIRKVPLVHVLREAFPEDLRGIYDESEVDAMRNTSEGEKKSTNDRVAEIFSKKDGDEIIEGEVEEVVNETSSQKPEPDILLNELKIYIKALKVTDATINKWFEKANASSLEELPDDIKQKCIDNLKPKYEALKGE